MFKMFSDYVKIKYQCPSIDLMNLNLNLKQSCKNASAVGVSLPHTL